MHHLSEHIKKAHESVTCKCNECDNVDSWMCDVKEHMIMMRICGILLVTMNLIVRFIVTKNTIKKLNDAGE